LSFEVTTNFSKGIGQSKNSTLFPRFSQPEILPKTSRSPYPDKSND